MGVGMKSFLKGLWGFVEVLIVIYVIIITACLLATNKYGFTQFNNTTLVTIDEFRAKYLDESQVNDLLIVKGTPNDIVVGDKIYYYGTAENKYTVETAHVRKIVSQDDTMAIYQLDDEESTPIASNRVLGKYSAIYPNIGGVLDVLESKIGFLLLVILPILLIFMYQIYALIIVIKYGDEDIEQEEARKKAKKEKQAKKKKKETPKKEKKEDKEDEVELL